MPDTCQKAAALFSRVEDGVVVRRLVDGSAGPPDLMHDWGSVGVLRIKLESPVAPPGHLLNHLVALNLGGEAQLDARVEDGALERFRLATRALVVMPADVPHELRGHGPADHLILEVAPALVAESVGAELSAALRPAFGLQDPFAEHVLLAVAAEARATTPNGRARVEQLASALVSHLAEAGLREEVAQPSVPSLPSTKLRHVLDYVAAHLSAPLGLRHLSELAGMDVFRFGRAFKQSTGISPHRYVLEARIERAKELLAERVLSITEVALATGFATPSHFSVTFRRVTGITPRGWREGQR